MATKRPEVVATTSVSRTLTAGAVTRLQADQAEADTRKAQALAEQRRANAIALEQEMKANVAENRAGVLLAQAEVPKAMADAFRQGNLEVVARNGST